MFGIEIKITFLLGMKEREMKNRNILIVAENSYFRDKMRWFVENRCRETNVINVGRDDNLEDMIQRAKPYIIFMETKFYYEATPFLVYEWQQKQKHTPLNIVMWTVEDLPVQVAGRFISLGAKSYIDFRKPIEETRTALLSVLNGGDYISEEIINASGKYASPIFCQEALSISEIVIMRLIVFGRSPREIADVVSLKAQTVRFYITRIYSKCAVHDRDGLILLAFQTGIVTAREFCKARVGTFDKVLKEIRSREKINNKEVAK
jgi:DNA-binding NarL/FixJ family response regulator